MGEVYKARDTRLDRVVAIKVLPQHLSASAEVRQRFEREAKTISQLSHPHICALYDVGNQDGVEYLVMEYLEGETLADRLVRGALPIEQTLRYGIEIADALDKAHRRGIVHRDLKPGNVMLTKSGVKLLDFGIAKAIAPAASGSLTTLPTVAGSTPLTQEGTILGTFQYMAPEQLEGKEADARTDIFAFGAVLYEMSTGKKAFSGSSQASLISAILRDDPQPISQVQPMSPPSLDRAVKTCLAKDPEDRFQTAHDVKLQLQWIAEGGSQAGAPAMVVSRRGSRERIAWIGFGAALLVAAIFAAGYVRRAPNPPGVLRATLDLPPGLQLDEPDTSLALSPDGRRLAMALWSAGGKEQLWVRPLDSLTAQPLAGTESATYPFWSPDSRSIGFFADGKLKKIDSGGGTIQTICDAQNGRGASWSREGVIVFAGNILGRLSRVPAAGGTPVPVGPEASSGLSHRLPSFLPDGRHLLFYTLSEKVEETGVSLLDLETGKSKFLFRGETEARYVAPGYLVFVREHNLVAQPFDARKLETTGEIVPIAEDVRFAPLRATGEFALSETGLLVFETGGGGGQSQLTWIDLQGKKLGTVGEPANFIDASVSPDGKRAVVTIPGPDRRLHLWMIDLATGVRSRFTLDESESAAAVWSPDARAIAYAQREAHSRILVKASSGGGPPTVLFESPTPAGPTDWSPDGGTILFSVLSAQTKSMDVWAVETAGSHKAHAVLAGPATETGGQLSPDGKWIAYASNETGTRELYVASYPDLGGRWQITSSRAGGFSWLGPTELYFGSEDGPQVVVLKPTGNGLEIGAIRPILGGEKIVSGFLRLDRANRRFLQAIPVGEQGTPSLHVVTNWAAALEQK